MFIRRYQCKSHTDLTPHQQSNTSQDARNSDKDAYLKYIREFKLDTDKVEHIRITLYGPVGSGKSSFINTIESAIRGRITGQALPDGIGYDSFTTQYKTHRIKKEHGSYYPFVFTDLMGLEKQQGITVKNTELILKGHVKDGYEFNPETSISSDKELYNSSPTINDKTHVLVCVVPANTVHLLDKNFIAKIRNVRMAARNLGIPQMALLTKIDEACPTVRSDLDKVYKSTIIKQKLGTFSGSSGIPLSYIFPVKNYHNEIELDENIDKLALMALKRILDYGQDFVDSNFQ